MTHEDTMRLLREKAELTAELKRFRRALETIAFSGATSDITASGGAPWYVEVARHALQENDDITIAELPQFLKENE